MRALSNLISGLIPFIIFLILWCWVNDHLFPEHESVLDKQALAVHLI